MAKDTPQPETDDARSAAPEAADATVTSDGTVAADDANADVAGMSYEAARDELVDIVARLEGGQVGLEDSMGLWQRGEALAAHCAKWLDEAEAKLSE
jgi:exodeoxyribonuclease VII small subunit